MGNSIKIDPSKVIKTQPRIVKESFPKEDEINFMAKELVIEKERMYSELSIYLQQKADEDRLKSLTSNQIRAMIEQFKNK